MNIENVPIIDYYSTNVNQFKCDICTLTFKTSYERIMHILNHLEKSSCSICHETLIKIGNIWYGPHKHSGHESLVEIKPANADRYETTTFSNNVNEFQFDPLSTKSENDSICNTGFDEKFLEKNNIEFSTSVSIKSENFAEIHNESVEARNCIESPASNTNNKRKNGRDATSERTETTHKNKRSKSPKSIVPGIKRQKRSSAAKQKCWKCELCDAEFLFEANLIEHQDEHQDEKISLQPEENDHTTSIDSLKNTEKFDNSTDAHTKVKLDNEFKIQKSTNKSKGTDSSLVDDDNVDISTYDDIKHLTEEQLNSLKCPICYKKFVNQIGLRSHLHVHKTLYTCKLCKNIFPTIEKYRSHKSLVHGAITKKSQGKVLTKSNTSEIDGEIDADTIDWICEYCNLDFELELNLAKHLIKEHGVDESEHVCNICTEKFTMLKDQLAHMRGHSESKQYKCAIDGCNHGFAYKASLAIHLNKHKRINSQTILRKTQENLSETAKQCAALSIESLNSKDSNDKKPMKCNFCSKELSNRASLLLHIQRVHMNQGIRCTNDNCNKIFRSVSGLRNHINVYHPDAVHKCDVCAKVMYSTAKFIEHQLRHGQSKSNEGSFECNICAKTFLRKHELRSHFNQHEQNISCTLCDEKFSTMKMMMIHREWHGKKKSILTCRYQNCNQVFEDRREFMKHASQHPETGKKRFICPHCGKSISRTYIDDHINTHTKALSYECSVCQKSFCKKSTLRRHLFIHSNKKPYVCDIDGCSQAYRDSIDLKRHKFSAHKIYTKKHICSICSKVFPERKLLTKHTINVHDKIDQTNTMH